MAEVMFKLLRCDAEASRVLGWAKKEVRRLVDHAKLDAFQRTWSLGDVTVRTSYFGGVARLWLEAAGTERMAVWATVGTTPSMPIRAAQHSYGWDNWIYRQAVTYSIWSDDGAVLYDKVWGDYTDANPAETPYVFAAQISATLDRLPYVVLPSGLSNIGAQYFYGSSGTMYYEPVAIVQNSGGQTRVRQFSIQRTATPSADPSASDVVTSMVGVTDTLVTGVGATSLAGGVVRLTSFLYSDYVDPNNSKEQVATESHVLSADGAIVITFSGGVVGTRAYGGSGTPFTYSATYTGVPYLTEYGEIPILGGYTKYNPALAIIEATAGPKPTIQFGQTLVFSGTDAGSYLAGVWEYSRAFQWDVIQGYTEPAEAPAEAPALELPEWVTQLQDAVLLPEVDRVLRNAVPRSDYTYKLSELSAKYVSVTPRVVRMAYSWTDEQDIEHEEVAVISGDKTSTLAAGGVVALYGPFVYSEHEESFNSFATLFGGFTRPYITNATAYIVKATEEIPPEISGERSVLGASAEALVVAQGAYRGGVLGAYDEERSIASHTVLGNVFPDRIYSGSIGQLAFDASEFSTQTPPITQQFLAAFPAKNNKKASEASGAYAYTGFYLEHGMYVLCIPIRLTTATAGTYTYEVPYSANCVYGADGLFTVAPSKLIGVNVVVARPENEEEEEQLGSVKLLLIYGGIKWDDVKEDARAQRKALNDPNDPAHDPLMKAVLDALTPTE